MVIGALLATACGSDPVRPGTIPETHTAPRDGAFHAPGLDAPAANCASCHGEDLPGGERRRTVVLRVSRSGLEVTDSGAIAGGLRHARAWPRQAWAALPPRSRTPGAEERPGSRRGQTGGPGTVPRAALPASGQGCQARPLCFPFRS
jgi:hypothetical protein